MDEELKNKNEEPVADEETKTGISADLIRGHINTIILRTLYERDKYGYEIIEEIEAKSHGQYTLKQPTLYSALKRLESQGYITAYWKTDEVSNGGRRKYYTLTDSGREITEKNQSEWEYSRTVIDSLISDRNFDFTPPPPSAVDCKILKTSTSRVPTVKDEKDADKDREIKYEEEKQPEQIIKVEEFATKPEPIPEFTPAPQPIMEQPLIVEQPIQQNVVQEEPKNIQHIISNEERLKEERRIHENYLRLISEPVAVAEETPLNPYSDKIDTDKLIYNKKPETERDYKNLIDNLFVRTVQQQRQNEPKNIRQEARQISPQQINYNDANAKANSDGLTVNAAEYEVSKRKKKYNRGAALFKSSLIVAVIMLVEFALSLAFMSQLKVNISYPIVILTLAVAQLLIFGILTTTDFGKCTRKPTSLSYLTTSIVLGIISVLIIFVSSLLLNVNFASVGDVLAKIIIPSLVALNIPIFAAIFYMFNR